MIKIAYAKLTETFRVKRDYEKVASEKLPGTFRVKRALGSGPKQIQKESFRGAPSGTCAARQFIYLFCNAMTTVSGVIFLYSYDTTLASVSSIHLDEQGDVAGAAAMAMLIVYISFLVRGIHTIISTFLLKRTQAWRNI